MLMEPDERLLDIIDSHTAVDCFVSKVKAAISNDLFYMRSTCGIWVFTSDPTPSPVKEKITNVLLSLGSWPRLTNVLVQFWAPHVTTGGRCFLSTSNQPFGITRYHEGLCAFRKLSMDYRFYVDMDTNKKDFGLIGRTFVQILPRTGLVLQCASNKEIPQLDHLVQCKIKGFATLPVLEPSSMVCIGVIEILSTAENINWALYYFTSAIRNLLQEVDLTSFYKDNYNQNPEVASDQESVEELSVEVINSSMEKNFDTSQMETEDLLNGGGMVRLQVAVEYDTINNRNDVISAGKSYFTATDLVKKVEIKTTKREHRQIETSISYEVLSGYFGMKLEDAAEKLGVSRSTLKRLCRQFEIDRWPSHKRNKVNHPLSNQDPSSSNPPINQAIKDGRFATIKAKYRDDIISFQLSFSSRMIDLDEEVGKRLKLETGTFKIKYEDGDGDRILIACDADLNNCLTSLGISTIKMFVEPVILS